MQKFARLKLPPSSYKRPSGSWPLGGVYGFGSPRSVGVTLWWWWWLACWRLRLRWSRRELQVAAKAAAPTVTILTVLVSSSDFSNEALLAPQASGRHLSLATCSSLALNFIAHHDHWPLATGRIQERSGRLHNWRAK